ncbi:virion core protein P4a [Deerpox virus W-848-83]|uniref:Virion core protein P4a n=1 Tax=Deerpox virus (strain Mule deer/United States/W-848-83/1983) TaxID=305674 RepID=Q08FP2_DPV83|nr:Virion core protein P4a [Deerpox virus W-848-83]ABI99265.1 virion core protein P4a [Deerpox virus W-848-83]
MMPINAVTTLDQLEDSEYIFKIVSTILPSICLDYKIDEDLKFSYVHPFDALLNPEYGKPANIEDVQISIEKLGINYLLDMYSSTKLFNSVIYPGYINSINLSTRSDASNNPINNTHSFNDLPRFTKELVMYRLKKPEYKTRFIGGYVKPDNSGFDILYQNILYPDLNFENTYLLNLLYQDVIASTIQGFRVRKANGIMLYRDFENLLGIRNLLNQASIPRFDRDFQMQSASTDHNIPLPQNLPASNDLITLSIKHLLLYYQYFSTHYTLSEITYNGDLIIDSRPDIVSIAASMRFQDQIPKLLNLYPDLQTYNQADITTRDQTTGNVIVSNLNLNITFVDISSRQNYFITLLNLLAKDARSQKLKSKLSLFWDGIDYQEYKSKKISDIIFYNSTCYVFGLFNKNNTTYCSMLTDVIANNEIPIRVCLLPRVVAGKTVTKLISEILESINTMSKKEFPKKPASKLMHIGLSENNFMRFFQLLRLITNPSPEHAIKEVLMLYIGFKLDDNGSPHLIKKESYQDFTILLFSSMGFKVNVRKSIIGSNNHTVITVRPRINRQYIYNMLIKASCSKEEAEKLISAAYDLLHFMVSAGDYKSYQNYYYTRNFFPNYFFYGGDMINKNFDDDFNAGATDATSMLENNEETLIHIAEPMNILDRIDIRGIFSACTTDEMMQVDAFGPENIVFKNNLSSLIKNNQLSGDSITQTMPLNILDKLVTVAGAPCSVSINELIDNISNDTDECDSTSDITEMINTALKETYTKRNTSLVSQTFNSVTAHSQKQLNDIKQASCQMASIFKSLAKSIYTIERIFNAKLSDEVKVDLLEKLKLFSNLSYSLYKDLISIETLKAILYIIKRNGRTIDDVEIGPEEIRKSYEIIKPKIMTMTNYYTEMSKAYFDFMKKNLNMTDGNLISFDTE